MSAENASWPYPGARWWKFDFHTHTPASLDTSWAKINAPAAKLDPEDWLLKFMEAGIDCVAITDHNTGAWIDDLNGAYNRLKERMAEGFRELHLFPGVEISVNGGYHLLAIFDPKTGSSDIDSLLGRVDYEGTKGDSDGVTRKSLAEVVRVVVEAGGLAIPAHVDQAKGMFRLDETGSQKTAADVNTIRQVFDDGRVLGMEVVDPRIPKPQIYEASKCQWSEVIGSDCHSFDKPPLPGSRYTWVKMAQPSLEGLRLALIDGMGFSIRRSDDATALDPNALPKTFIESIQISNARYMGQGTAEELRVTVHPPMPIDFAAGGGSAQAGLGGGSGAQLVSN